LCACRTVLRYWTFCNWRTTSALLLLLLLLLLYVTIVVYLSAIIV